jgi:hypothetical protein
MTIRSGSLTNNKSRRQIPNFIRIRISVLTAKKRTRQAPEVMRGQLLDTTEKLMVAEGYVAVTTQRVAAKVSVTGANRARLRAD